MPWHKQAELRDFSLLEVNRQFLLFCNNLISCIVFRSIAGVRGFSRETLIALIANIESREWRCDYIIKQGLPPEHPRASTTDNVECFLACYKTALGKILL